MRFPLPLLVLVAACSVASAPDAPFSAQLAVSEPEYPVRLEGGWYRAEIPFRFVNQTGKTLVIAGCRPPSPPYLQWWNGEEWRMAFAHVELQCLSPPFVVPPGTVIDDTLRVLVSRDSIGPTGHRVAPVWEASHDVGGYRLMWPLRNPAPPQDNYEHYLGGDLRPLVERVSNTFRLRMTMSHPQFQRDAMTANVMTSVDIAPDSCSSAAAQRNSNGSCTS